jgi:octaprenyl-diphosphate synthase
MQKLSLREIKAPIAEEMKIFESKFREFMKSDVSLLDKIMGYIVKSKGKQVRPMFVFLTAGALGNINETTHRGAALIELLHTATLVHDDVVDDAHYRRSFFSINALWKNKIAVLVGDYLLSRGLLLSIDNDDFAILKLVSNAVREMSEGELLQIAKARRLDITQEVYFEIIRQKTASLIASCCAVGASSVQSDKEIIEKARILGEKVGMAFQVKDDLFDYGEAEIGKPRGIDIKEKKMTLPLIYALQNTDKSTKSKYINLIKNHSHKPQKVREVIEFVRKSGGIEYTIEVMQNFRKEAENILLSFPESIYKTSLQQLIQFTIEREN